MVLHIESSLDYPRKYSIREYPELSAEMKGSFGYVLHRLHIYNHGLLSLSVLQPNLLRKIFSFVAFLWPEISQVDIYQDNICIGQSLQLKSYQYYLFSLNNEKFEIRFHTDNYMSVWTRNCQVALLHTNGLGAYDVKYEYFSDNNPELLLLFCVIIDCFQYEYCGNKVEYRIWGKDEYDFAVRWTPSDY